MYRKIDVNEFLGKRFGRLIVVGRSLIGGKKGKGSIWDCVCDCGNKIQVKTEHLTGKYRSRTRSCGCLHDENSRRFRAPGETGLIKVMRYYKQGAVRRGIPFTLTLEDFRKLTSKNCFYCGSPPSRRSIVNTCMSDYSVYYYNGLDRIDPSQGYHIQNVSPCCFSCNVMKLNQSHEDFLKRIALIYHRHQKEIVLLDELNPGHPLINHRKSKPILEIVTKKLENKTDSIFYSLKDIARLKLLYERKEYILTTSGAYRFIYKDAMGKKHHGNDASSVLKKWTDINIQQIHTKKEVRHWGQFTILEWYPSSEEQQSISKAFFAGSSYDAALQNFKEFIKERGVNEWEEKIVIQKNYTRQAIMKLKSQN